MIRMPIVMELQAQRRKVTLSKARHLMNTRTICWMMALMPKRILGMMNRTSKQ